MNIYIVTEDLGDGDVGLRYFGSKEAAYEYINAWENDPHTDLNPCWHESNPHELNVDSLLDGTFVYNTVPEGIGEY